jgi:hypothetical protein
MPSSQDAFDACERLEPIAYACGYTIAVYGSAFWKGQGNDIDVLAVPWRKDAGGLKNALAKYGYLIIPGRYGHGLHNALPVTTRDPFSGHLIDLQIVGGER